MDFFFVFFVCFVGSFFFFFLVFCLFLFENLESSGEFEGLISSNRNNDY